MLINILLYHNMNYQLDCLALLANYLSWLCFSQSGQSQTFQWWAVWIFSRSTADMITIIAHRLSWELAHVFPLNMSKVFDKLWHKRLIHRLISYHISGNVCSIIKSFFPERIRWVFINGQSSKVLDINGRIL